jgi:hypothetical protein
MHKKLDSLISIHPDVKKQVPGAPPGIPGISQDELQVHIDGSQEDATYNEPAS